MPDILVHFAVPFALSTPIFGIKRSLIIGLIAILPDLDVLLRIHRSMTHSLVILSLLSLPILLTIAFQRRGELQYAIACILSLFSHPIFDAFQTYTPILYPLTQHSLYFSINSNIIIGSEITPQIHIQIRTEPTIFNPFTELEGPLFTGETLPITLSLIIIPILYSLYLTHTTTNNSHPSK